MTEPKSHVMEESIAVLLEQLGYDLSDQHFLKTPARAAKVLERYRRKENIDAAARDLVQAVFDEEHDSMVIVGPVKVHSYCAHHMLPVVGRGWIGYVPDGRVCGLSKLARVMRHYAEQFTVQERVTQQVANLLDEVLQPKGVMVVIEAEHGCMRLRGVEEASSLTVTSAVRGIFQSEMDARMEFLELTKRNGR